MRYNYLLLIIFFFLLGCKIDSNPVQSKANDKVWLHRVNSIERLSNMEDKYRGVELDVLYDFNLGILDVTHDSYNSISLDLADYMNELCGNDYIAYIWLDLKNLNANNQLLIKTKLDSIFNQYNCIDKSRVVIESDKPLLLEPFSILGFKTSFYIPSLHTLQYEQQLSTLTYIDSLNSTDYLSSYYKDYELLKKRFPNNNFLFWAHDTKEGSYLKDSFQVEILEDPFVHVLLVPDKYVAGWR